MYVNIVPETIVWKVGNETQSFQTIVSIPIIDALVINKSDLNATGRKPTTT